MLQDRSPLQVRLTLQDHPLLQDSSMLQDRPMPRERSMLRDSYMLQDSLTMTADACAGSGTIMPSADKSKYSQRETLSADLKVLQTDPESFGGNFDSSALQPILTTWPWRPLAS